MRYAKVNKVCCICDNNFVVSPSRAKQAKYCSKECWNKRWWIVNECLVCWANIKTYKSLNKKYCKRECYNEHLKTLQKWENSHFWKWWKTKKSKIRKTCAEYKEWRKKVFTRDWFKCILCDSNKQIEADHIKAQSEYPELIYDLSNWRTLCHNCHKQTDNYWWKQQAKMKNTYK